MLDEVLAFMVSFMLSTAYIIGVCRTTSDLALIDVAIKRNAVNANVENLLM
jgi:hypothetical protein